MLLAALVAHRKLDQDPIAYVRKHYCEKAVESQQQVDYLVKEWGCVAAKPRHRAWEGGSTTTPASKVSAPHGASTQPRDKNGRWTTGPPVPTRGNVWGKTT
jgi:hypothetical protein